MPNEERRHATTPRVALVTGASRGIGRAITTSLCREGYRVVGVSRPPGAGGDPDAADSLRRDLAASGYDFVPVFEDVSDLDGHRRIVDLLQERFGRLDLFVSNAGIAPAPRRDVLDMTPESYDRVLDVNLRGSVFLAQAAARFMLAVEAPLLDAPRTIIFVSSISAAASSVDRAEYCIAKAGLSMAARVLADRLAGSGVTVFEVRPGIIRTDMTAAVRERYDRRIADGLVPQRRWGEPDDVARAVVALARGDFGYSTGMIVEVDGGLGLPRL